MEHNVIVPTAPSCVPPLLFLTELCHLEIFKFLKLEDSISLAGTCSLLRSVANSTFKKSTLQLDSKVADKGKGYIDYVFSYIAQHVSSLNIACSGVTLWNLCQILRKISDCNYLKCLRIFCWNEWMSQNDSSTHNFGNVELLALKACNPEFVTNFLENFNSLKALYISHCSIDDMELRTIFQNNPNIEHFVCWSLEYVFDGELLELIPMVKSLALDVNFGDISELNSLLELNRLTKLRLNCDDMNINCVLEELAKKGIMEEMHLIDVDADDHFFDILMPFDQLQLLVLESIDERKLKSSINWPTKLKRLLLKSFKLTHKDLLAMIRQLKSIEMIDIWDCDIMEEDQSYFKDVASLSQEIVMITDNSNRKHRLDVVLPWRVKLSGKDHTRCLTDSERLRILHRSDDYQLEIKIHFPGYDSSFEDTV